MHVKNFNEHNVRQRSPANINSYKRLATFTGGAGRMSKRRSKRRSVNPAKHVIDTSNPNHCSRDLYYSPEAARCVVARAPVDARVTDRTLVPVMLTSVALESRARHR